MSIDDEKLAEIKARAVDAVQERAEFGGTGDVELDAADVLALLAERESMLLPRQYVCPCCGRKTLQENPEEGTYEICTACWWEVDPVQGDDPDYPVGANHVSLNAARANYQRIGVSEERFIGFEGAPAQLLDKTGSTNG